MKRALSLLVALSAAAFLFADGTRVDLRATLTGPNRAKGKAEWQTRDQGTRMQAELEVEGEHLAHNAPMTVTVGDQTFAVTTNDFGSFELELRFNGPVRPTIVVGTAVAVTDGAGDTVLTGMF